MNENYLQLIAEQKAQEEMYLINLKRNLGNRKIRLLFVNSCLVAGGLEKTIWLIAKNLDRSIFEPEMHSAWGGKWEKVMQKVMPLHKGEYVPALVSNEGFKVVHLFNMANLYHLYNQCALVETVEGYGTTFLVNLDKYGLDKLIFCSESMKDAFIHLIHTNTDRVHIMPNPVDLDLPIQKGKLKKLLNSKNKIVGWIGRLSPEKNPDLFIEAADKLHSKYEFVMIGDAWYSKDNLEYFEKIKQCRGKLHWIRNVEIEDMMDYIADMDLLCNTSHTEGHPFTMLEAMAVKTPTLSLPVGSIPDFIKDGKTGFFVYNKEDYATGINKAIKYGEKIVEKAYATVLMNHNLKDYIRRMEIHYIEAYNALQKGRQ